MSAAERLTPLDAAWRHNAALTQAIKAGRHDCWCGVFGSFRFTKTGLWFCFDHTAIGPDGLRHPVPQPQKEATP